MNARRSTWVHVVLLLAFTEAIYVRPSILTGAQSLIGLDYAQLHIRRITFARDALFGPSHSLPAWYPHELLGAPFSANLQNFPWIPTRLVLLLFDPASAFAAGVAIAAALAALFTFLYCRRAGLSDTASAIAGWTFACAGYFASRVTAGHLPLLEAYPALPLLLWLSDRAMAGDGRARGLVLLAGGCACVALAGHPQVPAYAIAAAISYVAWRARGRRRVMVLSAMVLGIGMTLAAWWPMLLLVERSTRVLHLAPPENDISLPYARLLALVRPGIDGWPDVIDLSDQHEFDGYPGDAYFWDTTAYVGLLPLASMLVLLGWCIAKRRVPHWPWSFLAVTGAGALLLALPLSDPLRHIVPGTFLRSPSRLLYLSTYSAAAALGCGMDAILNGFNHRARLKYAAIGACLAVQLFDLGGFARLFVQTVPAGIEPPPFVPILEREVHNGRVAASVDLIAHYRDRYDDIGVFDSVLLADPYRAVLGLNGDPPDLNIQRLDGSELRVPALRAAGVRFVMTTTARQDLEPVAKEGDSFLYRVPDPAPRAAFYPRSRIDFVPGQQALSTFLGRAGSDRLIVPTEAKSSASLKHASYAAGDGRDPVRYTRPSSDEIRVETGTRADGFVQVLESYDPGWEAAVDGAPAPVLKANGFSMAVAVPAGIHTVRLRYSTPGRITGWILSIVSATLLFALARMARPRSGHRIAERT